MLEVLLFYNTNEMGQLVIPSEREIKGPWLLSSNDFLELEEIINSIDKFLATSHEAEVKETVLQEMEKEGAAQDEFDKRVLKAKSGYRFEKRARTIMLISDDEKKLKDSTIKGILKDQMLADFKPTEFYSYLQHGNNSFKLEIKGQRNLIRYDLDCYDSNIGDEIRFEIERWTDKRIPPKPLQFWSNQGDFLIPLLIIPLLILTILVLTSDYTDYKTQLKKDSEKLLKEGINSSNINKAIEVLLKLEGNYTPPDFVPQKKDKDPIYLKLLLATIYLIIISSIRPKTTIGLGKKKSKLTFTRIYIKFVTITVPAFLIISPLWGKIIDWIY